MAQPADSTPVWQPTTPPEDQWRADWLRAAPELEQLSRLRQKAPTVPVLRTSQLDAARLDTEISALLREQFMKIFALFRPGLIADLHLELGLLLDALIFANSIWVSKPTPGSALLNLRYRDERSAADVGPGSSSSQPHQQESRSDGHGGPWPSLWQRTLYGLGAVLGRYLWTRAEEAATARHWGNLHDASWVHAAWRGMQGASSAYRLASLVNFLVFLRHGTYRSLLERVLRMRLVYRQPAMARALSFEYLNRQLVWHELSELLLFLLPLVSVAAVKRFVRKRLAAASPAPTDGAEGQQKAQACTHCGVSPIPVPYSALPCGHVYCYFCLCQQCAADPRFCCEHCFQRVAAMRAALPPRVEAGQA